MITSAPPIAWITRHPANLQVVLGTTKPDRVRESVAGSDVTLTREEWYRLFTAAGLVRLNPPPDTLVAAGDQVIAISEDDDTVVFGGIAPATAPVPALAQPGRPAPAPARSGETAVNKTET